jgi:hypothetical protein
MGLIEVAENKRIRICRAARFAGSPKKALDKNEDVSYQAQPAIPV